MSTWELRFQFGLLHCKKGHSIFVVRFFCRLTILTHDLFYYRSSLPQNTHIHTHTHAQADHRGVICHQSATSSLWASAWATTLSIQHGNLPASIFPFRHFIALFAYFLSYFNFGFSRRACFAKYLRFLWPDPPQQQFLLLLLSKVLIHTRSHTHFHSHSHCPTHFHSHSDTRTHPLSAACHYRKRRPGCP